VEEKHLEKGYSWFSELRVLTNPFGVRIGWVENSCPLSCLYGLWMGLLVSPSLYACPDGLFLCPDRLPKEFISVISHVCPDVPFTSLDKPRLSHQQAIFSSFLQPLSLSLSLSLSVSLSLGLSLSLSLSWFPSSLF